MLPALSDFNWASVIFVTVLIGSMIYFAFRAKDRGAEGEFCTFAAGAVKKS
jgi:hypothetical protein